MDQSWSWLGWLLAGLATFVAVRASIRFDVNEWLRERRKRKENNLRRLCPHAHLIMDNGSPAVRGAYISPMGTTAWQCQLCGDITYDRDAIDEGAEYWSRHPDELITRQKEIARRAKKLGLD